MAYFLYRLLPPRPSFSVDMTSEERQFMTTHVAYWMTHVQSGECIAFGPVADPRGGWGVALLEAADQAAAQQLVDADPALLANAGLGAELLPMPRLVVRPSR